MFFLLLGVYRSQWYRMREELFEHVKKFLHKFSTMRTSAGVFAIRNLAFSSQNGNNVFCRPQTYAKMRKTFDITRSETGTLPRKGKKEMHQDPNMTPNNNQEPTPPQPQENPMHIDMDAPKATPMTHTQFVQERLEETASAVGVPAEQAQVPQPTTQPSPHPVQPQQAQPQGYVPIAPNPQYHQTYGTPVTQVHSAHSDGNNTATVPPVPPTQPPAGNTAVPATPAPQGDGGKKKGNGGMIALFIVAIVLFLGIGTWLALSFTGAMDNVFQQTDEQVIEAGEATEDKLLDAPNQDLDPNLANLVAEKAMPSIVTIYTYEKPVQSNDGYSDILELLMNRGQGNEYIEEDAVEDIADASVMTGLGSGVIIREDGYILTNNHVVDGADKLMVSLGDDSFEGEIVGTDPESDLAVVKVDAGKKLDAIEVADSNNLRIGDWVMAIGAPLGYEQTATTGIVSALGRDSVMDDGQGGTTVYANMIQTDAAINSGNSGGALVNDQAELIGVNTLVAASSDGYSQADNLGFAIPSTYAIAIANQIIEDGVANHAKLGVVVALDEETGDTVVTEVVEDGAAAAAGIKAGDVIVSFDGDKVTMPDDVIYGVRSNQPGDEVIVTIQRDGQEQDVKVVLGGEDVEKAQDNATDKDNGKQDMGNNGKSKDNKDAQDSEDGNGYNGGFHGLDGWTK